MTTMHTILFFLLFIIGVFGVPHGKAQTSLGGNIASPHIIGGHAVNITEHPHQVSIHYMSRHMCGGVLISSLWVLTAAHCIPYKSTYMYSVRAGTSFYQRGGQVRGITKYILHPQYDAYYLDYDIAAVRLSFQFNLDVAIQTVPLATALSSLPVGTEAVVTGWGTTDNASYGDQLQEVRVPIISQTTCVRAYGDMLTDRMICASSPYGGRDACQGDSGGPLTVNNVLYGLVSWGDGCALADYPGVYTSVANLRTWVKDTTGV